MKRCWKIALLLAVPLALFAFIAERNSWRPKTIEVPGALFCRVQFSPDGRLIAATLNLPSGQGTAKFSVRIRQSFRRIKAFYLWQAEGS